MNESVLSIMNHTGIGVVSTNLAISLQIMVKTKVEKL